jgi:selenide, water dikinase
VSAGVPFRLSQAATTGGCAAKIGPGDLSEIVRPMLARLAPHPDVVVGAETGDDAGVYRFHGHGLIATTDFIPPLCDDPFRFGRIAAANALSDVFAMGGEALFALNLSLFPTDAPKEVLTGILEGAASAVEESGAALLGGHSVKDKELKFGLAVVGVADPARLLANSGARPGNRLVLTKPLGSGVLVNAFKQGRIDEAALEPALVQMERLNLAASRLALRHGATAATDVTGFGLAGHAWNIARESKLTIRIRFDALAVLPRFYDLVAQGVTTGCTTPNRAHAWPHIRFERPFDESELQLLFDPQTSGPLLIALPAGESAALVKELRATGHDAAEIAECLEGAATLEIA